MSGSNSSGKSGQPQLPPKMSHLQLDGLFDGKKRKSSERTNEQRDSTNGHSSTIPSNESGSDDSSGGIKRSKQDTTNGEATEPETPTSFKSCEEVVRHFIELKPLSDTKAPRLNSLTSREKSELDAVLELDGEENTWRDDWSGNLALAEEGILNPDIKGRKKQSFRQSLLLWATHSDGNRRLLHNLIRHVANTRAIPAEAKRILTCADPTSTAILEQAIQRTCYDPVVLEQDGWSIEKSEEPEGASGGAHWIGSIVRWLSTDAVVLAYVYDSDIGDLWRVAWIEDDTLTTFDLEAEELREARKKWERRQGGKSADFSARKSSRLPTSEAFFVAGMEEGIVLASSFSKNARQGVYWPARVVHPSENGATGQQTKRNSSKQKLELMFLAPYWDSDSIFFKGRKVDVLSESGVSLFHRGALFQVELLDASHGAIQYYPFDPDKGVNIEQLRNAFRFTGLPKGAFPRFLDSHRLALGLKLYARRHLKKSISPTDIATAGLFETHPVAVKAPVFPSVLLHLPFSYILSQLPTTKSYEDDMSPSESVLQLSSIVAAMKPPNCWGSVVGTPRVMGTPNRSIPAYEHVGSTPSIAPLTSDSTGNLSVETVLEGLLSGLPALQASLCKSPPRHRVIVDVIADFLSSLHVTPAGTRSETIPSNRLSLFRKWACLRSFGEDVTGKSQTGDILHEWRVASERIYRYFVKSLGPENKTLVLTDWRCNGHVTNGAAFERCVRLPAALKGARLAGLGTSEKLTLAKSVSDKCIEYVESTLLMKAHEIKYLDKIKTRCNASQSHEDVFMLTEDSEGNGGHDTRGSRGTWKASVCAVAAAVTAVDGVVNGECVNAFCATRPPGHHAGRALHPMKAVSNGFCVLNPAACAAIHATTPVSEGGCGLRRVCVIDFDVHHGNGTQDILCSTYDARFLYVSIHAGGSLVNGLSLGDDLNGFVKAPCANKSGGIYPGRCGDTSPHAGVLNIPLGQRVTPHDVGSALINRISPAVEAFSPNLIILSAGFDAHKHDPMGLGTLSAEDFGHITEVACQLAFKMCSGRLVSILEGGYGIPCCRLQKPTPTPAMNPSLQETSPSPGETNGVSVDPERASADETNGDSGSLEQVPVTRQDDSQASNVTADGSQPETKVLDLGDGMPEDMDDQLPQGLPRRLDKCHLEGFIDCVKEHVSSLAKCNVRK